MMSAMTDPERRDAFLRELTALTLKYDVAVGAIDAPITLYRASPPEFMAVATHVAWDEDRQTYTYWSAEHGTYALPDPT